MPKRTVGLRECPTAMIYRANTDAATRPCPLCQAETAGEFSGHGEHHATCPSCGVDLARSTMFLARLQTLARKHPGLELEEITTDSPWPLGGDSLTSVEVMLELERELGISINARDAELIMTVGQAIRYFEERTRSS
jgi:acyl carrier protein